MQAGHPLLFQEGLHSHDAQPSSRGKIRLAPITSLQPGQSCRAYGDRYLLTFLGYPKIFQSKSPLRSVINVVRFGFQRLCHLKPLGRPLTLFKANFPLFSFSHSFFYCISDFGHWDFMVSFDTFVIATKIFKMLVTMFY